MYSPWFPKRDFFIPRFCVTLYSLPTQNLFEEQFLTIMKRLLAILFIVSLMAVGTTGALHAEPPAGNRAISHPLLETQTPEVRASWLLHPPTIDGDLSDWGQAHRIYLSGKTAAYPAGSDLLREDDLSGWISVIWTSDRVLLALSVRDEYVVRKSRNWRHDDMASVVFDVDRSGDYSVGDIILTLSPDNLLTVNGGWPAGYEWAIHETETGWAGEVSIPMREFGGVDFLGDVEVGFTWGIQDNDGVGVESWMSWAGPEYLRPTPDEGSLVFVDGPVRKWIAFHPGVDGYDGIVDATLASWTPDQNFGEDANLTLYSRNQYHIVMKFDIPDLGPDVRVLDGKVHLNVESRNHDWTSYVRVYRLLRPWDEGSVTWNMADASTAWARPGAESIGHDREGRSIGTATLDSLGWVTFDLADNAVRDMYENPDQNYGIIFRAEEGSAVRYLLSSSESGPDTAPWIEVYAEFPPEQNN